MPKSLSHVVVLTDDLEAVVRFLTEVANVQPVERYETRPRTSRRCSAGRSNTAVRRARSSGPAPARSTCWRSPTRCAIRCAPVCGCWRSPTATRRPLRDAATAAGFAARGPFATVTATGGTMHTTEVIAGGIPFELTQFS